jgi:malate synthase
MEDAATAEISRSQVWQWVHHAAALDDGRTVTLELVDQIIAEDLDAWKARLGEAAYAAGKWTDAAAMFRELVAQKDFVEFLTLPAYDRIVAQGA